MWELQNILSESRREQVGTKAAALGNTIRSPSVISISKKNMAMFKKTTTKSSYKMSYSIKSITKCLCVPRLLP